MGWSWKNIVDPTGVIVGGGLSGDSKGLLGGGGSGGGVNVAADPYGEVRNKLNSWLTSNIGQAGKKYTGEMVAPMSEQEKQSLAKLGDYSSYNLANDTTFQNAKNEINKTLTNQYDPTTSPYYQAVKAEAARNLDTTNKGIASQAAGGGRYFSGARMKQQQEAGTSVTNALNTMLGQMSENERARRLSAVPMAQSLSEMESQFPLRQATALQTLGALPRTLQQAQDQASLDDWIRSEITWPTTIGQIAAGVQQAPLYQQKPPSFGEQLMSGVAQMAPQLAMMAMMGCWIAAQVFGSADNPKTVLSRRYINYIAPLWLRSFYLKHGVDIALFIKNKPIFKIMLRPLFELFAILGKERTSYAVPYSSI